MGHKATLGKILGACATFFLLSGPPGAASAATYYVAPTGDNRAGGTRAAPWQTLAHAVQELHPGDTLIATPGRYAGFTIYQSNSGTAAARVRILGRAGAVIDATLDDGRDGINIEYASYIDIEGFTVTGASRAGIRAVECEHVHIRKNNTHDNGKWGIFTGFCDNLVIENNLTSGAKREHGIYVSNSAKNPTIRGNRIFNNAMNGIHTNGDATLGGDGMTVGAVIENNLIYGNGRGGGAAINNDGMRDSLIRNNIIYDNYANGVTLYSIDGRDPSTNNRVVHNTIIMPTGEQRSRWCLRIADASTDNVFQNNICVNGHHYRGAIDISMDSLSGFVSDYNLVDSRFTLLDGDLVITLDRWRDATGCDTHSLAVDYDDLHKLFVDPASHDWRLASGSIAIDRGAPGVGPNTDYLGHYRDPMHPDIGALERCSGAACTPPGDPVLDYPGTSPVRPDNSDRPMRRTPPSSSPFAHPSVAHRIVVRSFHGVTRRVMLLMQMMRMFWPRIQH